MQRKHIDKFFRQKLQHYKPALTEEDDLWANIEAELDKDKRHFWRRRNIIPALMLISFSVLLSYTGSRTIHGSGAGQGTAFAQHSTASVYHHQDHNTIAQVQPQLGSLPAGVADGLRQAGIDNANNKHTADNSLYNGGQNVTQNTYTAQAVPYRHYLHHAAAPVNNGHAVIASADAAADISTRPGTAASLADEGLQAREAVAELIPASAPNTNTAPYTTARRTALEAGPGMALLNSKAPEADAKMIQPHTYTALAAEQKKHGKELLAQANDWQSLYTPFWHNAAYTGAEGRYNFNLLGSNTYLENAGMGQMTGNFGYDMNLGRLGVGVFHEHAQNQYSLVTSTGISAAMRVARIGAGYLRAGVGYTVLYKELYAKGVRLPDEADPFFGFINSAPETQVSAKNYTNGYNAGLWYGGGRLTMGLSMENINAPHFGLLENAQKLPCTYQYSVGYRFTLAKGIDAIPMVEMSSNGLNQHASLRMMLTYRNKAMIGASYENINPQSKLGELTADASVQLAHRVRLFASFGRDMQYQKLGVHQNTLQTGIRVKLY